MRIHIAANSEGYEAARAVQHELTVAGHEVVWHAAPEFDDGDDYPGIAIRAVQAVVHDEDAGRDAYAVILGGAGAGEVIAANKVNGARVVSATDPAYVVDARAQADINGLVIATAHVSPSTVLLLIDALLATPFSNDIDDARRLVNVAEFEAAGTIEGWTIEE
jgi:ribose 5-phosphate isomerase B